MLCSATFSLLGSNQLSESMYNQKKKRKKRKKKKKKKKHRRDMSITGTTKFELHWALATKFDATLFFR